MNQEEFIKKYKEESPAYEAWGRYVCDSILMDLKRELPEGHSVDTFLKLPVKPRLKELVSIINKAFNRGKKYACPYAGITDKVGVRFVVLLIEDIKTIEKIIKNNEHWAYSEDRDFEKERLEHPMLFDYQSKHYIVTNTTDFSYQGVCIKKDVNCEIQIRTLLQHAYSELTHDTVYKPNISVEPEVHRIIARSMALIETTDDFFSTVTQKLANKSGYLDRANKLVSEIYLKLCDNEADHFDKKTNLWIIDSLKELIMDINIDKIEPFIKENIFLVTKIKERRITNILYYQPVILLVYYLIKEKHIQLKKDWPLTDDILKQMFTDLGKSFNSEI